MVKLVEETKARIGYLGSGQEIKAPHRKVTLAFDDAEIGEEEDAKLFTRLAPVLEFVMPLLHCAPSVVRPNLRMRECQLCNSTQRPHQCPFMDSRSLKQQPHKGKAEAQQPASRNKPQQQASGAAAVQQSEICRNWLRNKQCSLD